MLFILRQAGGGLTGEVEGAAGGFFGAGGGAPARIEEGKVEGNQVSFKAGNSTYSGTLIADRIELERTGGFGFPRPSSPAPPAGPRPAIGPPPDGSDPSRGAGGFGRPLGPLVLRRVKR
jgi:beta-galactosidase